MTRHAIAATLCLPLLASPGQCDVIRSLRKESRSYTYRAPTPRELTIAERLFRHLLAGERNLARVTPLCREIDLDLVLFEEDGEEFLALFEREGARRGRGFYVFRRGRSSPVMLQVPHAFYDRHTGPIGRRLLAATDVAVAAWNTVARTEVVEGGNEKADLAHLEDSYFQALTVAFARVHPKGRVIQLHGFSKEGRSTVEGAVVDVVISNGTQAPDRGMLTLGNCLGEQLTISVAVYPRDISELGGTTNVQSKLLRRLRHGGFLHLELSLEARRRLLESEDDRRRFWRCFREQSR